MHVMAACVHFAGNLALKGKRGFLLHGQRVQIRAESNRLSGFSTAQKSHHRGTYRTGNFQSQIQQGGFNQ